MKVFVVTSGDWSDYEIEGVFSSRELADKCAELRRSNVPLSYPVAVEEWDVLETLDELKKAFPALPIE